ncbi:MAG: hypothetical protein Q9218_004847 [Villophora microphyllina]
MTITSSGTNSAGAGGLGTSNTTNNNFEAALAARKLELRKRQEEARKAEEAGKVTEETKRTLEEAMRALEEAKKAAARNAGQGPG